MRLLSFLHALGGPPVVLTGAGLSTDSGIPDYRGPHAPVRLPMTITEFRSGTVARQRYWARSHLGWQRMRDAVPNAGHRALAALQHRGAVAGIITQNVDGLDSAAGAAVIDLHGRLDRVLCLDCGQVTARAVLERRLTAANPGFGDDLPPEALQERPDGDVDLADTSGFTVVDCARCGGVLKPDVVFFGENVAAPLVARCYEMVDAAPGLLVVGSSLTVQSGLRFVRRTGRAGRPVAIVNRGATRGDEFASLLLATGASETLSELVDLVCTRGDH